MAPELRSHSSCFGGAFQGKLRAGPWSWCFPLAVRRAAVLVANTMSLSRGGRKFFESFSSIELRADSAKYQGTEGRCELQAGGLRPASVCPAGHRPGMAINPGETRRPPTAQPWKLSCRGLQKASAHLCSCFGFLHLLPVHGSELESGLTTSPAPGQTLQVPSTI